MSKAVATLEESTPRPYIQEAKLSASKRKGNILSQAMLWQKRKWFGRGCQSPVSTGRRRELPSEPGTSRRGCGHDGGHRGLGPQPGRGSSGVRWATEPDGETNLSEVMLSFQAGGERTSVPRWDSSSCLRREA